MCLQVPNRRQSYRPSQKDRPDSSPNVRPIAVGEALRHLVGKCPCLVTKSKVADFFDPLQFRVACSSGAEKVIHGLRNCMDKHWNTEDFVVLKVDMRNAFNVVSRQAVLDECSVHFPELLPWVSWCYGQHPILWHTIGTISSEAGVQQGDPLGPLIFCLVLQKVVSAIAADSVCSELLFHAWYLDDSVVAGPRLAVENALSIIQELGPPLGLFVNPTKCELFGLADLNSFPIKMKRWNDPHLKILGAPIGDLIFCAKIVAQKHAIALKLLNQLSEIHRHS